MNYYAKTDAHCGNVEIFKLLVRDHGLTICKVAGSQWHFYTIIGGPAAQYPERIDFWPHKIKAVNTTKGGRAVEGYGEISRLIEQARERTEQCRPNQL